MNLKKFIKNLNSDYTFIDFLGRNMIRINNEYNKYNYNFMTSPFYLVNENHFRIHSLLIELNKIIIIVKI